MLKYINENLQVGDHITIESKTEVYQGVITELETASLSLSCEGRIVQFAEDDITGLQYIEDDDICLFPLYLTKVYPYEKHPDSFFGLDYNQRLHFDFFYGVLSVSPTNNTNELGEDLLLPDWVEYEGILYAVEGVGLWGPFPNTIKSVKLPFFTKNVEVYAFKDCNRLETVYLPSTVQDLGSYKVGGCTCCELCDMQGQLLNWELEKDWY